MRPHSAPGRRVRPCLAVLLGQRRCSLLSRASTRAGVPPSPAAGALPPAAVAACMAGPSLAALGHSLYINASSGHE